MGSILNGAFGGNSDYQATGVPDMTDALIQSRANYGRTFAQQLQLQQMLQDDAANGSQLAQNQLTQATDQNIAQQQGLISSQKGINPAMAGRVASQNAGNINQQAANQSAQLKYGTQ